MTAPTLAPTSRGVRPAGSSNGLDASLPAVTGTVALGMLLTTLPLRSVFTDWSWLTVSIGCALPYLAIVALARSRTAPRWWHSAAGLAASLLMLLWVFVPQHLALGVLPTGSSFGDLSDLVRTARDTVRSQHAPLASTQALRLLVAAALVALAVLTDVLAILLRHPLLASAPLLEVLVVASATSSRASNPIWFAAAALGFLLIMLAGTRLQDRAWGPSVDGSGGRLGGARRMAVTGVVAALIVPAVLPSASVNVLARAAHHNGGGSGQGGSGQIVLNSLASLRGSLQRPTPVDLFRVQVTRGSDPFYIRQEVDDMFTNDGWRPSGRTYDDPRAITPLGSGHYPVGPQSDDTQATSTPAFSMNARFTILALGGTTLPILANPAAFGPPSDTASWNSRTSSAFGVSLKPSMTYTETVKQPAPKVAQLEAATRWTGGVDAGLAAQLTFLPPQPDEVAQLASRLAGGERTPYDKARAISSYFTNPRNGFSYALNAPPNDGRNALVTFLDKKTGYCQQYAAAAAVLMRQAGLPARVVIGYTHHAPDANGVFTVTTSDAHSWVEVFFNGIGWVPFDPTPLAGADSARAVALPWATHAVDPPVQTAEPTANRGQSMAPSAARPEQTAAPVAAVAARTSSPVWRVLVTVLVLILVLAALVVGPRLLRRRQRRRRLDRARSTGNPETLWQELAATAADREALWPDTVTVGQVPGWLSGHGMDASGHAALTALAARVERDRFSARRGGEIPAESITELDEALSRWARRTDRRLRLVHRWIPRSLIGRHSRWSR